MLVYVVESQFALNAVKFVVSLDDGNKSEVTTTSQNSSPSTTITAIKSMAKLALGLCTLQDVSLNDLVIAKNSYGTIAAIVMLPALVPFCIILIAVPQYRGCVGCAIFIDVVLGFIPVLGFYVSLAMRMVYVAWKLKFPDTGGLFSESKAVTFGIAPIGSLFWLVILIDPGQVEFNRVFMFEWIMAFNQMVYWAITIGWQMVMVHNIRRTSKVAQFESVWAIDSVTSFLAILNNRPEVRQEFQHFATSHYCIENLYFIDDVSSYKTFFREKAENWHRQKARVLYDTYIKAGGALEINISGNTKATLHGKIVPLLSSDTQSTKPLLEIFDQAIDEIFLDVLRGVWKEFEYDQKAKGKLSENRKSKIVQHIA
jgi:hypothetical protein